MKVKYYLVACLLLAACNTDRQTDNDKGETKSLQQLKWMLGSWQNTTADGVFSENWQVVSDSLWKGEGRMMDSAGKILFAEQLELVLRADTIWYVPTSS